MATGRNYPREFCSLEYSPGPSKVSGWKLVVSVATGFVWQTFTLELYMYVFEDIVIDSSVRHR